MRPVERKPSAGMVAKVFRKVVGPVAVALWATKSRSYVCADTIACNLCRGEIPVARHLEAKVVRATGISALLGFSLPGT